ncbi:type I restriction-modification system specificity subunit [Aliivibrio fischeri ES114]|uniref:Type I restriction-modification system specificity subunit n=1 Tax=Aliivibrio fischeri (strain ATCC 700601 / ES114) TaxID=312309 RepID=Q5E038_ALIF1|nr:restriction endonuclease subunit S [Aliivibrio fischeri]AAW87608.1 type I restriction-modification system specificity subunit [Aliivibrio fischeri ES114]
MLDMEAVKNFSIDKSDWKKVKFGDVVFEPKESVKDPVSEGIEHVVGLEHIESGDMYLRRSASIEGSTTFTKKFVKGDVLFGRRRAYLKKAAKAKFSGICSGDITVMRARDELLLPDLVPFIVNNEKFFDYAITHSAGGLSPRVKFKDLANFEFFIPSKTDQKKLLSLLEGLDESLQNELILKQKLVSNLEAQIEHQIHGEHLDGKTINQVIKSLSSKKKIIKLKGLGEIIKGKGIAKSEVVESGIPCVRYGELYTKHHRMIRKFHSYISLKSSEKSVKLRVNDVLFAGSGETISEIGKSAAFTESVDAYAGSDILIFRPKDMDGSYLGYLMNSLLVRHQLNKLGTGATVMHVYGSDIQKIVVPYRDKDEQVQIANCLEEIASNIRLLDRKIHKTKELLAVLLSKVF